MQPAHSATFPGPAPPEPSIRDAGRPMPRPPLHHRPPLIERILGHPAIRSGYASLLGHVLIGILLAMVVGRESPRDRATPLALDFGTSAARDEGDPMADALDIAVQALDPDADGLGETAASEPIDPPVVPIPPVPAPNSGGQAAGEPSAALASLPGAEALGRVVAATVSNRPAEQRAGRADGGRGADAGDGQPFAARRGATRAATVSKRGGSPASERAVERGLAWLAAHQAVDGSWQFDLSGCNCHGGCRNPGTLKSSTASTSIVILPFLGAGNTHIDGPYQQTVSRAIYYLISRMQPTPRGGDFCEGSMYGHGVTTLALAEAYGMTGDDMLLPYLRDAIRFIQTAQDQHGGGWRYLPGQSGDTTVTAWQVAALKSATIAGIETPSPTIDGVRRFLDSVQANNGAAYGYRKPMAKPCTSAVGLLCRMYTGWGPDHEALVRGVTVLAKTKPSPDDIYQNFYLAQALIQMDHPVWPRWNRQNRDQLVDRQSRFGHEAGSWFFDDPDTAPGGRLAHTALAVLSLEVYYRLLPIYTDKAVQDTF